jgi:8-oxo-dGTP pyrophosphatase MutT (NUDIX family)
MGKIEKVHAINYNPDIIGGVKGDSREPNKYNKATCGTFLLNKENKILVGHPTHHPKNVWSIPKGKMDIGEDPLTTALRETYEETNIDLRYKEISFYALGEKVYKNKRKRLFPYLIMESENEFKCNSNFEWFKCGFPEMDNFQWLTLDEASKVIHESQASCLEDIKKIINN